MNWRCDMHDDCFALDMFGRCSALNDTQFKGKCPFYKTVKQHEKERKAQDERRRIYEY